MVPVVLSDAGHSGWNPPARETTFFRGLEEEKTKAARSPSNGMKNPRQAPLQAL
jgi:hypothetical protein